MFKIIIVFLTLCLCSANVNAQGIGGFLKRTIERKANQKINQKIDEIIDGKTLKDTTKSSSRSVTNRKNGNLGKLTTNAKPDDYYKFTSSIESNISTRSRTKGNWIKSNQKMYINSEMPVMGMSQSVNTGSYTSDVEESFSVFDFQKDAVFNFSKFDDVKMVMAVNLGTVGNIMTSATPTDKILHWKKIPESKEIEGYTCDRYLIELRKGIINLFVSRQEIRGFEGYVRNMQKASKENNSGWNLLFTLQKSGEIEFKEGQMVMAYDWTNGKATTKMIVTAINKDDAFEFNASGYRQR